MLNNFFSQVIWIIALYFAVGLKIGNKNLDVLAVNLSGLGYLIFVYVYLLTIREFTFKVDN